MNYKELDRLLCERLGIKGTAERYPALSTTGDGMLRLLEALKSVEHVGVRCHLRIEQKGAYIRTTVEFGLIRSVSDWSRDTSPTLALALAAAKALGIEVSE